MKVQINERTIELVRGDITKEPVDAIVNAANSRLSDGSGVNGAIQRAGGPDIMRETNERYPSGCPTGSAVISGAGQLPARFVIHAVGPVWSGGDAGEPDLLAGAYRRCLELASEHGCRSIAFPAISAGVFGYPMDAAARIAIDQARRFVEQHRVPELVRFVLFDDRAFDAFAASLSEAGSDSAG